MSKNEALLWGSIHIARCVFWYAYSFGLAVLALGALWLLSAWPLGIIFAIASGAAFEAGLHAKKMGGV